MFLISERAQSCALNASQRSFDDSNYDFKTILFNKEL